MPAHATVYAPSRLLPDATHLAPLAPGAQIEVDREASRVTLIWPDLRVTLTRMDDAEMPAHLTALQGHVRTLGVGEGLATRVLSTLSVYGIVIDPGVDAEGRAMGVVAGITAAADGLCFIDGDLVDRSGRSLLTTRPDVPSPSRIAARALCLLAGSMRALLESDAGKPDQPKAEGVRRELVAWVRNVPEVREELEPHELELLETPLGSAERQAIIDAVWRAEGAQVLLWALGARDLPPHDGQEHPFALAKACHILAPTRPALLSAARRSAAEIDALRLQLMAIHWRLVEARTNPGSTVDFRSLSTREFLKGVDLSRVPTMAGDLAVRGAPITKATFPDVGIAGSIALERHHAANWLIGVHPAYSRVVTPTLDC
jgi:hypothetical protein